MNWKGGCNNITMVKLYLRYLTGHFDLYTTKRIAQNEQLVSENRLLRKVVPYLFLL